VSNLVFGSNSVLRALAEVYASADAKTKFVNDFVAGLEQGDEPGSLRSRVIRGGSDPGKSPPRHSGACRCLPSLRRRYVASISPSARIRRRARLSGLVSGAR
jgi:hypothetical protein